MIPEIRQLDNGESYLIIPASWDNNINLWAGLPELLQDYLSEDAIVYIDLEEIQTISPNVFNILFDIARDAGRIRAKLIFTGASDHLEERISLLGGASE